MDRLEFKTVIEDSKAIILVSADMDSEQSGEALVSAFNGLFDRGHKTVVLDLSGVEIINSYGIGKILICQKKIGAEDGVLMVKPLMGFVREAFELLKLDTIFPVDQ